MAKDPKIQNEVELAQAIIAHHYQARDTRHQGAQQSRDFTRRCARELDIDIPGWEEYWKALDEWKTLITEREIERDLYKIGQAPTPPTTPIPRPSKPDNLEHVEIRQR
jgi:hypothetical protein